VDRFLPRPERVAGIDEAESEWTAVP